MDACYKPKKRIFLGKVTLFVDVNQKKCHFKD